MEEFFALEVADCKGQESSAINGAPKTGACYEEIARAASKLGNFLLYSFGANGIWPPRHVASPRMSASTP